MSTEPSSASAMSLTFWRIGLGLRAGTTPLTIPNAVSNASRLHKALIRFPVFRSAPGAQVGRKARPVTPLCFHPLPAQRPGKHRSPFASSAEFRLGRFAGFE